MTTELKNRLRSFFNELDDKPLEPTDPRYEPFLENNSKDSDPIGALVTRISWSDAASVNLLSGQRGSGKSTELRRLRSRLEDEGCTVFLCDMHDYMNLTTPVEVTDFFISVMVALNLAVKEKFNTDLTKESYPKRLINFLKTDVKIEDLTVRSNSSLFSGLKSRPRSCPYTLVA